MFFTVTLCDNVRIIATGYRKAAVLQVDIVISEDGHFLKETACSQEWLELEVTNTHQMTSHWAALCEKLYCPEVFGSSTCSF